MAKMMFGGRYISMGEPRGGAEGVRINDLWVVTIDRNGQLQDVGSVVSTRMQLNHKGRLNFEREP